VKKLVAYVFILFSSISIFQGLSSRWTLQHGDTAGFIDSFRPRGVNEFSSFVYGSSGFQLINVLGKGLENFKDEDLVNKDPQFNIFNSHAYLLPYLVRNFNSLFNSPSTLPLFLVAMSYGIGFAMLIKVSIDTRLTSFHLFTSFLVVITSPIFFFGLIGQPYMDRLFFGPCIAVMYLLSQNLNFNKRGFVACVLIMIIAALISERASLMIGAIALTLIMPQVRRKQTRNLYSLSLLVFSLLLISWYFIWSRIYSLSPYTADLSLAAIKTNLQALFFGNRQSNFITFSLCLAPFILSAIRYPKFFVICFITIIPNLFVNIGGAELTGYATHYHALYLPAIIFSLFIKNQKTLANRFSQQTGDKFPQIVITVLALIVSLNYIGNATEPRFTKANAITIGRHVADAFGVMPRNVREGREQQTDERTRLFRKIKVEEKNGISSPEGYLPALVSEGVSKVDIFPIGVGVSELIVVPFVDDSFDVVEFSLFGLVPTEDREAWSALFMNILERDYVRESIHSGSYGHIALYVRRR
jgi:hypothetical protein